MKFNRFSLFCLAAATAAVLTAFATEVQAAPAVHAEAPAPTNAAPVVVLAVFDSTGPQAKDPFYPHSTRHSLSQATTNAVAVSVSSFLLKGLSGSEGNRLALINNRTVSEGESTEVTTAAGNKVKIRCLKINKDDSVLIRVENQADPIELRFENRASSKIQMQY